MTCVSVSLLLACQDIMAPPTPASKKTQPAKKPGASGKKTGAPVKKAGARKNVTRGRPPKAPKATGPLPPWIKIGKPLVVDMGGVVIDATGAKDAEA